MARPPRKSTQSKPHPKSKPKSKPTGGKAARPSVPVPVPVPDDDGDGAKVKTTHRATAAHVFFFGGPLSNFHLGASFPGQRCLDLLLPALADLDPPVSCPAPTAFATRLLGSASFSCGEQWMMALKGWVFERDIALAGRDTADVPDAEFQALRDAMRNREPPGADAEREMWQGTLCEVLRAGKPRVFKALGRKARGFDEAVWRVVSPLVTWAACVARAERDEVLRRIYLENPDKAFVEGSPWDRVWGVGIHWTDPRIDDPANWMGENRLGWCHDQAAQQIREAFKKDSGT